MQKGAQNAMKRLFVILVAAGIAGGGLTACGAMGDDAGYDYNYNSNSYGDASSTWECYSANDCPVGQYCNEFHRCVWPPVQPDGGAGDGGTYVPPETEYEYGPPASGERYVYVALSDQDSVARIDSETLDILTVNVGDRPGFLITAPGQDVAVVLNEGSSTVSILRTEAGVNTTITLPTPPHFNRLAMGPLGQHAVAYFELDAPETQGIGSFQDVTIITLIPGSEGVVDVSVGFRPREVHFAPDESAAYVVTEDGVSILDLGGNTGFFAPTVPMTTDPVGDGDPDEVVITPDGHYALARWSTMSLVRAVDLVTGDLVDTPLSGPPTDLDLTPDGDTLLAVIRSQSELALLDLPGDIGDASAVETLDCTGLVVGSAQITEDGDQALLYTNASNVKSITLVDLITHEKRTALLRKGIRWVALAPDGTSALVLHNKVPGDPLPTDDFQTQLDKRYGFSLVDLESLFVKLQIVDADPGAFAFSPDGLLVYLIVADPDAALRQVARLNLENFIVDTTTVGSHPVEIGAVMGTDKIYISQEHNLGRISFIDVSTHQLHTVTGFQLNSQIIE
jgi:DNA-binding beta-propeller fold protein YncE